jgi:aminomethyltransferase
MSNPVQTGLSALATSAGFAPLVSGWIRITGEDRVRWLNGMTTNSVQALEPGHGAYTFFLNAQGRIQGDATVWAEADHLLLQTSPDQTENLMALLDRFIIMDDVELADVSAKWHSLQIFGAEAEAFLAATGLDVPDAALTRAKTNSVGEAEGDVAEIVVSRLPGQLLPRFELASQNPSVLQDVEESLRHQGAITLDPATLETLRILEGTPRFGIDIRDRDLPQETGQTRALHFNKGCYLGQEIVERIRSRGNVHRTFHSFELSGTVPAAGIALTAEGKPVGELTSIASLPSGRTVALGYIRREALDRNLPITFEGGIAKPVQSPIPIASAIIES